MLVKFAASTMELIEDARAGSPRKVAHRASFNYEPRSGYIYVRSRAISSRVNENFDGFRPEEIKGAWQTFIGKPVFVNHHNADLKRKRGVIIDAALHEDSNPDGTPDTWAEVLMEIDAMKFPMLAKAIVKKEIDRTSMGTAVAYTLCSFCGNKAVTPMDYCQHIARMKGQRIVRTTASGEKEAVLVYEDCHGLHFFENSVLVEDPADPTAIAFDVDTRGVPELSAAASLFRPMDTDGDPVDAPAMARVASLVEAKPRWAPHEHPWFQTTPVHPDNILKHWNRATDEDKEQGGRWYSDANLVAKALGGGNAHKGAGVLAAYSPQTLWPVNMHNAARALSSGVAPGGKGSGVFATTSMAKQAQAIIDGGRHEEVLKGPKIQDFAHLIEHGGDADPNNPHVVIDRHAMSVAAGHRLTDDEMGKAPVHNRHYYGHVVQAYKDAADKISQQTGHKVEPHAVQATTWLVRQRENAMEDAARGKPLDIGREKSRDKASKNWDSYALEHYPALAGDPGYYNKGGSVGLDTTGLVQYAFRTVGYGEQIAPPKVNTLLPEACPVCQNVGTWNDNVCSNCGFDQPPEPFDSPDLDKAQDLDGVAEGQPLDPADDKPPLYVGQRTIPSTTVERNTGMSNTPARNNLHQRLNAQQQQINNHGSLLQMIAEAVGVQVTAELPPEFLNKQKGSGDSDSGSSSSDSGSDSGPNKDSDDYKQGLSDGKAGKDKDSSKSDSKDYNAGYSAGKSSSSDSDSDSDSKSSDSGSSNVPPQFQKKDSSLADRRRMAYLTMKQAAGPDARNPHCKVCGVPLNRNAGGKWQHSDFADTDYQHNAVPDHNPRNATRRTAESNEEARAADAKDDPNNVGGSPAAANTGVTPDATTSVDSPANTTTLEDHNTEKIDVQAPTPGQDTPPSPSESHAPIDITVGTPTDNSTSFNTGGPGDISWKGSIKAEDVSTRLFAAMKLAKLRRKAGIETDDELVLAQKIVDDETMPIHAIRLVSSELERIIRTAEARQAARSGQQQLVPQAQRTATVQRVRPSLAAGTAPVTQSTGEVTADELGFLAD